MPGNSSEAIGPVIYYPSSTGKHSAKLIIRNNINYIDTVILSGEAQSVKLSFTRTSVLLPEQKGYVLSKSSGKQIHESL